MSKANINQEYTLFVEQKSPRTPLLVYTEVGFSRGRPCSGQGLQKFPYVHVLRNSFAAKFCFHSLTFYFGCLNIYFEFLPFIMCFKFSVTTRGTEFLSMDLSPIPTPKDYSIPWAPRYQVLSHAGAQPAPWAHAHWIPQRPSQKAINSTVLWERTTAINSRLSSLAAPRVHLFCVAERSKFHRLLIWDIPVAQLTFC